MSDPVPYNSSVDSQKPANEEIISSGDEQIRRKLIPTISIYQEELDLLHQRLYGDRYTPEQYRQKIEFYERLIATLLVFKDFEHNLSVYELQNL